MANLSSYIQYSITKLKTDLLKIKKQINLLNNKQNKLESGKNIKTINNISILGEGNLNIGGGGLTISDTSINAWNNKQDKITLKTINGQELIGTGNIQIESNSISDASINAWNNKQDKILDTSINAWNSKQNKILDTSINDWNNKQDKILDASINAWNNKQDKITLKTINGQELIGTGNITINTGSGSGSGASTADAVSFVNTNGMSATNVQTAIEELNTKIDNHFSFNNGELHIF